MRGARSFLQGRFESAAREAFDDGWTPDERPQTELKTEVTIERARSIVSHNDSPDVGFDRSINPYRGCEHGCIYCYARPSHAYLELSPGLDFETKLFAKTNAAELLREALAKPGYKPQPIALGANTDCYQPIERRFKITRQILEVLAECEHPVTLVTKSALVERDLDLQLVAIPVAGVVAGIAASVFVGAVAGIYPAIRAARTPPTEALRS